MPAVHPGTHLPPRLSIRTSGLRFAPYSEESMAPRAPRVRSVFVRARVSPSVCSEDMCLCRGQCVRWPTRSLPSGAHLRGYSLGTHDQFVTIVSSTSCLKWVSSKLAFNLLTSIQIHFWHDDVGDRGDVRGTAEKSGVATQIRTATALPGKVNSSNAIHSGALKLGAHAAEMR